MLTGQTGIATLMITDFEKNCYHSPLTLENAKENTFLESTFKIEDNKFRFWLKHDNTLLIGATK